MRDGNENMIYNDADIEMIELANLADEDAAETCLACGESYQSITFYVSADYKTEVYECICGHSTVWINHKRLS